MQRRPDKYFASTATFRRSGSMNPLCIPGYFLVCVAIPWRVNRFAIAAYVT